MRKTLVLSAVIVLSAVLTTPGIQGQGQAQMPAQPMSFFITSVGMGDGANLGGLTGADAHCQKLAAAAGAGNRTWHAYLSQTQAGDAPAVNARGRIGNGPWYNAKGQLVASNVADLHGDQQRDRNNIRKPTALNEKGGMVNGVGVFSPKRSQASSSGASPRSPRGSDGIGRPQAGRKRRRPGPWCNPGVDHPSSVYPGNERTTVMVCGPRTG